MLFISQVSCWAESQPQPPVQSAWRLCCGVCWGSRRGSGWRRFPPTVYSQPRLGATQT